MCMHVCACEHVNVCVCVRACVCLCLWECMCVCAFVMCVSVHVCMEAYNRVVVGVHV